MQTKDFQIHIPKPCHADWDKMSPNEHGKFCSLCDKTVVDFTQMNEQEIKNFFIQKTEERVCGHFKASQVVVPKPRFHQFLMNTYQAIESKVSFYLLRQPALFMLGGFMFLVGCDAKYTLGKQEEYLPANTNKSDSIVKKYNLNDTIQPTIAIDSSSIENEENVNQINDSNKVEIIMGAIYIPDENIKKHAK